MPYSGFFSFLDRQNTSLPKQKNMYQCPSRAFFRFRLDEDPSRIAEVGSINALAGLFFVSGGFISIHSDCLRLCINALAGLFFVSG